MITKNKNKKQNYLYRGNIIIGSLVVVGIFIQLMLVNDIAQQKFLISEYTTRSESLAGDVQRLSVIAAELSSTERLLQESNRLQLVKIDRIQYLESPGAVALKQ